jgi:Kef-type K+ transport system membrane component KefB
MAPTFFAAAAVILLVCRIVGRLVQRIGQPLVVGEMIAGVMLGPSLLGWLAPEVSSAIFPPQLKPTLYVTGQIGLVALMFRAGYDFRKHASRSTIRSALTVSAAGITVPLALGIGLTLFAQGRVNIFVNGISPLLTAAFVGVALAITAFPMLARIIIERGLAETPSGALALAAGGTDDVVAWILLAGVLSLASGAPGPILIAVGGAVVFVGLLILVVRPILRRALEHPDHTREGGLLTAVLVLFAAAWFTDTIQLFAVFGAFGVGMVTPRTPTADHVVERVDSVSRVVFLPMFFTYSGLNTRFTVLGDPAVLAFGVAAVVLAVLGKFGACTAAAMLSGQRPVEAARVGALMNARGLMQLIALNIALEAKIINTTMFSALILVAAITTMMAAPALAWLDAWEQRRAAEPTRTPSPDSKDSPDASDERRRSRPLGTPAGPVPELAGPVPELAGSVRDRIAGALAGGGRILSRNRE